MNKKLTFDEMLAVQRGESLEEYRNEKILRARIYDESQKYIGAPVQRWPKIKFNWDIEEGSQRFCFDGNSIEEFNKYYPEGLKLGYVSLNDFDKKLCHYSRRDGDELWQLGSESKLAHLIVYLSEGQPISPPVPKPTYNEEVILIGGHHRYAIAKVLGEENIPICVCPEHIVGIKQRLNVEWVDI